MIINENYKIESDNLNVTLYEKRIIKGEKGKASKRKGESVWDAIAYYSCPENALKGLVRNEITGTGMKDLKTVVDKINDLDNMIKRLYGLGKRMR